MDSMCIACNSDRYAIIQSVGIYAIRRCRDCGLVYVAPLPSSEKHKVFHSQQYFFKYYGCGIDDFYNKADSVFEGEKRLKSARLAYVNRFCRSGKLLDIGTGQGLFPVLAKARGWDVSATDISAYVCEFLSKHKDIEVFNGYLEEAGLAAGYFDAVTAWHVLEHTYSPYNTLREIKRILKPGGHLFIAVPNTLIIEMYIRKLLNKPHFREDISEWHFYCFNPKSLRLLLSRAGFKIKNMDCEFYLQNNAIDIIYNHAAYLFLRLFGINICKTILIHAMNSDE